MIKMISRSFLLILLPQIILSVYIPPGPKYKCPPSIQIWPCICVSSSDFGLSVKCQDVSLATASSAISSLKNLKVPIEVLRILQLNAYRLFGSLLDGLNITTIIIEDSPLESISSDFFYYTRKSLKVLELRNTQLTQFPAEAFQELDGIETLIIDGHGISNLSKSLEGGLVSLKSIAISNGNVSELSKGTFSHLGKLTKLDLHGNKLSSIPKDSFNALKDVVYLDISHNQFNKLDPTYFVHLQKLIWMNASHNEITEFKRGAFARNSQLRVIHLTHNKMSKLDTAAFRGMRLLRRLYLSDNQISDIGRAAFNSLNQVGTIDLARNKLHIVDFQMFTQLKLAEEIDISQNQITRISRGAFKDLAYLSINMSHNLITTLEPESFANCVNITILDMSYNQIDNFTRGSFDEYTYPTEWRLDHNKLRKTNDIPLKFMSGIKILNVSYNELDEISKNTFPKLYELHTLDLSNNNITKIAPSFLQNLFSLRYLDLSFNNLSELSGSVFGAATTLIDLKLNNNKLKKISNAALSRLASLRDVDASSNHLSSIFQIPPSLIYMNLSSNEITSLARAWPTMNSLLRLDLSKNKLGGHLDGGSFSNLAAVQRLNLSHNDISEVPTDALSTLTTIQYLDLSYNSISNLTRKIFGRLPIVFQLLLGSNRISSMEIKSFEGFLQLLHIDLSNNQLSDIPVGTFAGLASLRLLNLSGNSIERTENGTHSLFEENLSLETIDLSRNKFTSIASLTFPESPWIPYRLQDVDLSYNSLVRVTRELLKGTRKMLKKLNLSNNKISEIRPYIFGNMTHLEELNLNGNLISYIDLSTIGPPLNLTNLILSKNYLRKFPTEIFLKSAPLSLIDLSSNKIGTFDPDFLVKIKNGSRILLNGNPFQCDCRLIPLKRFSQEIRPKLSNFSADFFNYLENFECPPQQQDHDRDFNDNKITLGEYSESELICDYSQDPLAPKFHSTSDLEIRSFTQKGQSLDILWRVKGKRDVSGFHLQILDRAGEETFSQTFDYDVRRTTINLDSMAHVRLVESVCLSPRYSKRSENIHAIKVCQRIDFESLSSRSTRSLSSPFIYLIILSIYTLINRVFNNL